MLNNHTLFSCRKVLSCRPIRYPPPRKVHLGRSDLVNLSHLHGHLCVLGKRKEKIGYREKEERSGHGEGRTQRHCSTLGISQESVGILVLVLVCNPLWSMKYLNDCFQLTLHLLLTHFERLWFLSTKGLLNEVSDFK